MILSRDEIVQRLNPAGAFSEQELFRDSYAMKLRHSGNRVFFRGLVEVSNVCAKNCLYCGIRCGRSELERFTLSSEEIIQSALWSFEHHYGSVVLQAGERTDEVFISLIETCVAELKERTQGRLGITLSLGEQHEDTYRRWFEAGAHRYLLRIETSSRDLYRRLHPPDHSFDERVECLNRLRRVGFQVGTGVMIGLPFQTRDNLAEDILFFKAMDVDMIGMGPFIPHSDTPLANEDIPSVSERIALSLRMIAVTRLVLEDVNIASTTALQTLHPEGRELGLKAGANILMPNVTAVPYKRLYSLYDNKPCIEDSADHCADCLERRIRDMGETIAYDEWGDSPHAKKRHGII